MPDASTAPDNASYKREIANWWRLLESGVESAGSAGCWRAISAAASSHHSRFAKPVCVGKSSKSLLSHSVSASFFSKTGSLFALMLGAARPFQLRNAAPRKPSSAALDRPRQVRQSQVQISCTPDRFLHIEAGTCLSRHSLAGQRMPAQIPLFKQSFFFSQNREDHFGELCLVGASISPDAVAARRRRSDRGLSSLFQRAPRKPATSLRA